ncbi:MAG: RraA family protein [Alphaproteobacteria bacterium]|jgi:regulator of RNase E activity RraA|nr:RraA family protein [Alphaproteobacteria bacterium]MDP6564966.1 RraA family protein [Alphaproteobacteria bacterium]MDP6811810.1 RraA family protein [Alphaproteobacteria bacterium]
MIGDPVALRIRRDFERPGNALVRAFARAQTSFIADAQQGWNCLHHTIKPLNPKHRFAGPALTASGGPRDNLAAMAMLDHVKKGDVLVIATDGDESGAVIGDHYAAIAKRLGAIAIVTDGLIRDGAGIEKLGPPTFARGASPNAGYRNGPGEVNLPVSLGGVTVRPGDIVIGDRDGVAVVPLAEAAAVKARLDQVIKAEKQAETRIAKGQTWRLWDPARFEDRGVEYLD